MAKKHHPHSIIIAFFMLLKLIMHLSTNTRYGFHRDEYLYLADGQHLAWGFMEVPPLTPCLGWIAQVLGGSLFAVRLFPALAGVLSIYLVGDLVRKLGGQQKAIIIACSALILSPALSWSNTLFQPVSFNQLFWLWSIYYVCLYIQKPNQRYAIYLGIIMGLGILNKYSIVFYLVAILMALLLTPERKYLFSKDFLIAVGIALLIAAPNIYWQFDHNWPVLAHMQELSETQLGKISLTDYLLPHSYFYAPTLLLWLLALPVLFFWKPFRAHRFVAIAFLFAISIIGLLNGKAYYGIGAYAVLFVFVGIFLEPKLKSWPLGALLIASFAFYLLLVPLSLPVLSLQKLEKYCAYLSNTVGLSAPMRWEDGTIHPITQDVADMHGWEEIPKKVAQIYHQLGAQDRNQCMVYGESYGHAGAMVYYQDKYDLPDIYSLNAGFAIWVDKEVNFNQQIYIAENKLDSSSWFSQMILMDSITHPYAREKGYIYYRTIPKRDVKSDWKNLVEEIRAEHNF